MALPNDMSPKEMAESQNPTIPKTDEEVVDMDEESKSPEVLDDSEIDEDEEGEESEN